MTWGTVPSVRYTGLDLSKVEKRYMRNLRQLTLAEWEMEQILTEEKHLMTFFPNVYHALIPEAPTKMPMLARLVDIFGGVLMIERNNENGLPHPDAVVVTTEFESVESLITQLKSPCFETYNPIRPHKHKTYDEMAKIGKGGTWTVIDDYQYSVEPKKDRTNNKAKWKNQTKLYHKR